MNKKSERPNLGKKPINKRIPQTPTTSWGGVADWYDTYLEKDTDNFQEKVIAPNLLRILDLKKETRVFDLACGQGFFTRKWALTTKNVSGADISQELIAQATKHAPKIQFYATPAHTLPFLKNASLDVVTIVLAIQNISNMQDVFNEVSRVLVPGGRFVLVINHPAFRAPKRSSWQWDEKEMTQYRRIDGYLSSGKIEIVMHPGKVNSEVTYSYHRPLQEFFKALSKSGFAVGRLEEWISHKKSQKGPRQETEDRIRKEIPMFMMLEAIKK